MLTIACPGGPARWYRRRRESAFDLSGRTLAAALDVQERELFLALLGLELDGVIPAPAGVAEGSLRE